jgi:NTP pyrophosphatase (non-canonical NTP hydrolase)
MDKYEETKRILNDMASVKMAMNSHKGNIEDIDEVRLVTMLKAEVTELEEAIQSGDLMQILQEAADVQNFLLGVVHQQVDNYRRRK